MGSELSVREESQSKTNMIEFCSKKKMLLGIAGLIFVSVVVLLVENNMPLGHEIKDATRLPGNLSENCEDVTVEEECTPCSSLELKIQEYCSPTGYKERIKCQQKTGGDKRIYRSCPKNTWIEERNFWLFQSLSAVVGGLSYVVVCTRQKRLDRMLADKVHRQIAAGV